MVDVGDKPKTGRVAVATALLRMLPATRERILAGKVEKGDVLAAARLAGIMAAKRTPDFVPLCHPIALSGVEVTLSPREEGLSVRAQVKTVDRTGVEMEALTAACAAALTVYDMCKSVDRGMVLDAVQLEHKSGGRSGTWDRDAEGTSPAPVARGGKRKGGTEAPFRAAVSGARPGGTEAPFLAAASKGTGGKRKGGTEAPFREPASEGWGGARKRGTEAPFREPASEGRGGARKRGTEAPFRESTPEVRGGKRKGGTEVPFQASTSGARGGKHRGVSAAQRAVQASPARSGASAGGTEGLVQAPAPVTRPRNRAKALTEAEGLRVALATVVQEGKRAKRGS